MLAKDYTGQKFNRLTAMERIAEKGKQTFYRCVCDCGTEKLVNGGHLSSGATKSCGCLSSENTAERNRRNSGKHQPITEANNLEGKRFGRLVVDSFHEVNNLQKSTWCCLCDCGNKTVVTGGALRSGSTLSCGCLQRETAGNRLRTHGKTKSLTYSSWQAMWARCTNPKNAKFAHYKDKTPPQEWKNFEVFLRDMGERPSSKHTLDRIDNNKGYGPKNCRWATYSQQARNQKKTRMVVTSCGTMSLTDACEDMGFYPTSVQNYPDRYIASGNGLRYTFKKAIQNDNPSIF